MIKKYLYPKEIFTSREPAEVTTVLGSCISICLFDPQRKAGGINHFMLPESKHGLEKNGQYGNYAIPALINKMLSEGSSLASLQASICGGYRSSIGKDHFHIGEMNIKFARSFLHNKGIQPVYEDTGGYLPRKLIFLTATGQLFIKFIEGLLI